MGEPSMINTGVIKRNPFPGIRPFTSAEDKYFFGRDGVISEVLDLLRQNRFVTVVGASASGKTSLIQSGIIPALITEEKREWIPVSIRPGPKPVESLVQGFHQVFPKKLKVTDIQAFLSGTQTLSDLIVEKGLGSHNYLLIVDQFEELFRFGPTGKSNTKDPNIKRFVDLLVEAVKSEHPDIYVMLSIRSDYIEASSAFRSLTDLMNRSKYLLPQMSREALSASISGPVQHSGASLEPGFVAYLLEDIEGIEVALPQLQHALMRTWDHWSKQGDMEQSLTIGDYQAIGSVDTALNNHLEQVYEALNGNQKLICESLFKSITAKSDKFGFFNRQASMGSIARITGCNLEDLAEVVEVFSRPGRAFLSTSSPHLLSSDTIIELSHESLIGIWERLHRWVDEEDESIRMYLKLSEASALYQQGRTELWKPPDLQMALQWRETQKPTPAWAVQYNPAFERAMVFLSTSEEELTWEEERKVQLHKRRLLINRLIAIVMGVLVIGLTAIFIVTRNRPAREEKVAEMMNQEYSKASQDYQSVPAESEPGTIEEPIVTVSEPVAIKEQANDLKITEREHLRTEPEPRNSNEETGRTYSSRSNPSIVNRKEPAVTSVNTRANESDYQAKTSPAPTVTPGASSLEQRRIITIAKEVAEQSLSISRNPDLQGLLAFQAYQLNSRNNGKYYDVDIYKGLYDALKKLISPAYNIYPNLRTSIKDIQWLDRTGSLITVSSDGSLMILSGNLANRASQISLDNTGQVNECIVVSQDESVAAVGTNGGGLLFLELENRGQVLQQSTDNGNIVLFLSNLGNSGSFISAGTDNRIYKWDYKSRASSVFLTASDRLSALGATSNGNKVAFGTRNGNFYELNSGSPDKINTIGEYGKNHVLSIAYSSSGQYLVAGLMDGSLKVLSGEDRRLIATLTGPEARVTDLSYSPDGRFLAAASHDGNVYLWNTSDWKNPPIVFSENKGFVLSVCFSSNSKYFFSGSVDYPRFIGRPAESAQMVEDFCSLLGRNLTQAEWSQYFGNEIPYEKTCPGLN